MCPPAHEDDNMDDVGDVFSQEIPLGFLTTAAY